MNETFLYRCLAKFLKFFGTIYVAFDKPKVTAKQIRDIAAVAKPGDIISRKYDAYLDNKLISIISKDFCHAGIIVDNTTVLHSVSEGVCKIDIIDFIKDADSFAILRPKNIPAEDICLKASALLGAPYDFLYQGQDNRRYYCFEYVLHVLRKASDNRIPPLGKVVTYSHILNYCNVIYKF